VRSDLKIEEGGFVVYEKSNLGKVNALRRAKSLPDVETPITPTKGQALFTTAEEMHGTPASCVDCVFHTEKRCALIGPRITIDKITKNGIEYFPCCGMQTYGPSASLGHLASCDPDYLGLIWINAPKVGQRHGGANCGGCDGGDDCDHYIVDGAKEKWDSPTGFCRALQTTVACGDVCALWGDDDELGWREAQKIIND